MGLTTFGVVSGTQISGADSTARLQPGTIYAYRTKLAAATFSTWSLVAYVRFNVATNKGECQQHRDDADNARVELASTTIGRHCGGFAGVAAATQAASAFGFVYIGGYVPFVRFSSVVASESFLTLSGSTAGFMVVPLSDAFNATAGVVTTSGTVARICARALGAASNAATDGTAVWLTSIWY